MPPNEFMMAWETLLRQRDMFNVQMLLLATVGYGWYRWHFQTRFRLALAGLLGLISGGILWGFWLLLSAN